MWKSNREEKIRKRIFGKSGKPVDLTRIHHKLMKTYGWIPLEEFRELPIPTAMNLLMHIMDDEEAEAKEIKRATMKGGRTYA